MLFEVTLPSKALFTMLAFEQLAVSRMCTTHVLLQIALFPEKLVAILALKGFVVTSRVDPIVLLVVALEPEASATNVTFKWLGFLSVATLHCHSP
jgi:hypothetical protein